MSGENTIRASPVEEPRGSTGCTKGVCLGDIELGECGSHHITRTGRPVEVARRIVLANFNDAMRVVVRLLWPAGLINDAASVSVTPLPNDPKWRSETRRASVTRARVGSRHGS